MTKLKLLKGAAITAALLVVAALSCADNPALRARYQAEKMFFEAEKSARNAAIRPELNTPETTRALMAQYRGVLEYCYLALDSFPASSYAREHEELNNLSFKAAMRLSQLSFAQREYDSSIAILERHRTRATLAGVPRISIYLNLGRAWQAAGNWDSALAVYDFCIREFDPPLDERGKVIPGLFNLPAHIVSIYGRLGDTASANAWIDRAESYYRRLADNYPQGELDSVAHASLAEIYERTGRWQQAADEFGRITDSTGNVTHAARLRIATLHASRLGRPEQALREFDDLLADLRGRDTLHRPNIIFNKALVLLHLKEYAEVRQLVGQLKIDYRKFFDATPAAQLAVARSFEEQGNWERAETEYNFLIENYAGTAPSMDAYLYLVAKYREQGRDLEAQRMEERAELDFNQIAATRPGSAAEAEALSHKAELYRRRADWPKMMAILTEVFDKFPTTEVGYDAAVTASVISREKLGDPQTADSLLQELRRRLTEVEQTR